MHKCWSIAASKDYDYYLWLNDDVIVYDNYLDELIYCSSVNNHEAIISGIIEDEKKEKILYVGADKNKNLIKPNGSIQFIHALNGNCVLIPRSVFDKLGNLDPYFHHDLGDVDYGFRALKSNINVLTTRLVVGSCIENRICRVRKNHTNIINRFKSLYSPLGSPPHINLYFRLKYYGYTNAIFYFIFLHFLNLIPDFLNNALFKKRYS